MVPALDPEIPGIEGAYNEKVRNPRAYTNDALPSSLVLHRSLLDLPPVFDPLRCMHEPPYYCKPHVVEILDTCAHQFPANLLVLRVLDRIVRISCQAPAAFDLLTKTYGAMRWRNGTGADLEYLVEGNYERGFRITRAGCEPLLANEDGELLYLFEKDLTIELQRLRRDLYFVHAAAVEFAGKASLLVGASGEGKSTTTWGLLHHGFRYLSDELAAVSLHALRVYSYAHALCLKEEPPRAYPLPRQILRTSRTLHVPAHNLPSPAISEPLPIRAVFFLERCPTDPSTALEAISSGEAAARLFVQALNPLAHSEDGLSGAIAIARRVSCFRLRLGDLRLTCDLLNKTISRLREVRRERRSAAIRHVPLV